MKNQKGNALLVFIIVIVLAGLAYWWFSKSGYKLPGQTAIKPSIQNTSDLDAAAKTLDNTNLNEMDAGINQVNADSSSF